MNVEVSRLLIIFIFVSCILTYRGVLSTTIEWPSLLSSPFTDEYPKYTPLLDVIRNWNPDNADPPEHFIETLQHFNYSNLEERRIAEQFRNAEIPFKLYGVPNINEVKAKWTNEYLTEQMSKDTSVRAEISKNNHFMFWKRKHYKNFNPPTEFVDMPFTKFLSIAQRADADKYAADIQHFYFHKGEAMYAPRSTFIGRDITIFTPGEDSFFVKKWKYNKGIQCRFGMRGVIAETHYDSGRNMIAMLKGSKRYILTPPHTCPRIGIISDVKHPSYRHSVIDWSDISQAQSNHFEEVDSIDTIVRAGEILYVPSYWFHYIVSLEYSIQCNTRSGSPEQDQGKAEIDKCFGGRGI